MSDPIDYGDDLEYDDPELTALGGVHDFVRSYDLDQLIAAVDEWDIRNPVGDFVSTVALVTAARNLIAHSDRNPR